MDDKFKVQPPLQPRDLYYFHPDDIVTSIAVLETTPTVLPAQWQCHLRRGFTHNTDVQYLKALVAARDYDDSQPVDPIDILRNLEEKKKNYKTIPQRLEITYESLVMVEEERYQLWLGGGSEKLSNHRIYHGAWCEETDSQEETITYDDGDESVDSGCSEEDAAWKEGDGDNETLQSTGNPSISCSCPQGIYCMASLGLPCCNGDNKNR